MLTAYHTRKYLSTRLLKGIAAALILIAAIAIFLYTLLLAFMGAPLLDESNLGTFKWILVGSAIIFLIHFTYLLTVGWDQLFKYPHDKAELSEVFLIVLLTGTYLVPLLLIFWPVESLVSDLPAHSVPLADRISTSKFVATIFFATVYSWWAIVDWRDLHHLQSERGRSYSLLVELRHHFDKSQKRAIRKLRDFRKSKPNQEARDESKSALNPVGQASPADQARNFDQSKRDHIPTGTFLTVQKAMWMGLDFFLALTLWSSIILYEHFDESALFKLTIFQHFTIKELAVMLALGARFFSLYLIRLASASDELIKHRGWQASLNRTIGDARARSDKPFKTTLSRDGHEFDGVAIDTQRVALLQRCSMVITCPPSPDSSVASETPPESPVEIKCLVVNCGTGVRTAQLLKRIKVRRQSDRPFERSNYRVRLFGYHHDNQVGDMFRIGKWISDLDNNGKNVLDREFTSELNEAQEWATDADVLIILHSTYDAHEAHRVKSIVAKLGDNAVVIARGFADHSILATVCYQHPDRWVWPTPHYHLWNHGFLREIAAEQSWKIITPYESSRVDPPSFPPAPRPDDKFFPIKIIAQNLRLDDASIAESLSYLEMQLPEVACNGIRDQLNAIASATIAADKEKNFTANMDDYVYCFLTPINRADKKASPRYDDNRIELQYGPYDDVAPFGGLVEAEKTNTEAVPSPRALDLGNP